MTRKSTQIILPLLIAIAGAMPAVASPLAERVTGEGRIHEVDPNSNNPYTESIAVAAFEDESGRVWGTVTGQVALMCNFSVLNHPCTFTAKVDCLDILLNEAWIYAVITNTDNAVCPDFTVEGPVVVYIRDLGPTSADLMNFKLPGLENCPSTGCGSFPDLNCCFGIDIPGNENSPVLASGNFTIRSTSTKPEHPALVSTWSQAKRLYQ